MSNRSWSSESLVLSLRSFGDGHRYAVLLLPDSNSCQLLNATVFGAAKSKLRGLTVPYHLGRVWLYSNWVKNTHKVTDFDVSSYRLGLRDSLIKLWAASLAAEIAEKSKGNVDWTLINAFLDGLEISPEKECRTAVLRFLWRILLYSGVAPNIYECSCCGAQIVFPNNQKSAASSFYLPETGYICNCCMQRTEYCFELSQEALLYLFAVEELSPKISRNMPLSAGSFNQLKHFLFYLINKMIDGKLNTLKSLDIFI